MAEGITFYSKREITCPVCNTSFRREDLLTGGGRLSAGSLTNELRRHYIPTKRFGEVIPLIYPITVCPTCYYAADKDDFLQPPQQNLDRLSELRYVRGKYLLKIFGAIPDFEKERDIYAGIASYILAISCMPFFDPRRQSPTVKSAIYSLRAAWLLNDLFGKTKDTKYEELSKLFYRKAAFLYQRSIDLQSQGKEPLDGARWLGPDTDKNYGYDGLLYVNAILKYKMAIYIEDPLKKIKVYEDIKRTLSKVFGIGKKAKHKPEVLLNFSREIYEKISDEMSELKESISDLKGLSTKQEANEDED